MKIKNRITAFYLGLLLSIAGMFGGLAPAQAATQVPIAINTAGNPLGYWESLPSTYATNPTQNFPILIYFHGLGDGGTGVGADLNRVKSNGPPAMIDNTGHPLNNLFNDRGVIVLSPQAPGSTVWWSSALVRSFLNYAVSHYRVDPSRIYLTGLSAGSFGINDFINLDANAAQVAGVVVTACRGKIDLVSGPAHGAQIPYWALTAINDASDSASDSVNRIAGSIAGTSPTNVMGNYPGQTAVFSASYQVATGWVWNSGVVAVSNAQPLLTLYLGSNHNSWDVTYDNITVWNWLFARQKAGGTPINQPPAVNAGTDGTITLPTNVINVDGTVTDDGLPSGSVTTTWSKVSGPGTVTFGSASAVDTTATFSVAGNYVLRLTATDGALSGQDEVTITVQAVSGGGTVVAAINCGKTAAGNFTGSDGTVYVPDSVPPASGGTATVGTSYAIAGTTDDTLFDSYRWGPHAYNIPLSNGTYQVTLRFSDNATAANVRKFNVTIEGVAVLTNFDIFAQVGTNTVCDKVFTVPVSDGTLNIQFANVTGNAKINAIVVKTVPFVPTTVAAINCGKTAAGNFTGSDSTVYVPDSVPPASGGTATVGTSYAIAGTTDDTLFDSYRWGTHSYNLSVANGNYEVTLRFSDNATAANVRKFNVALEGAAVLTNFDIFAEVGTNTVCDKVFTVPVTDGILNIQFTNVTGNAKINAIVVKTAP
jgi:hypothetical protein